ncbi:MAG: RluA family pseudouridine synthase [Pseudomonadota bacterium]
MSEKENPTTGAATSVRYATVDSGSDGQRIDNYLSRELPGVPKSRIYRMLRTGEVRVNKGRVKPTRRVQDGDIVRIPPISTRKSGAAVVAPSLARELMAAVLFEDKDLLVINKPGGLAVHGGSGLSFGVVEALRTLDPAWHELSLAHRLDRETSGVLVLAKRRSALRRLHEAFREDRVSKVYLALVDGYWEHGTTTIDLPLAVHERKGGERHVGVSAGGKPSVTEVSPTESRREATLLTLRPRTGRTHQIRVHLAHMGHPIAQDQRYGDAERNKAFRQDGLPRLFLHAQSIAFDHGGGTEQIFNAPLSDDLQLYLERVLARPSVTSQRRR